MKGRLLTILSLGVWLPSFALADVVPAGEDTFRTTEGAYVDLSSLGGPKVDLMGNPGALGFNNVDTIVERKQKLDLDVGEEGTVDIELIALSLKCAGPINIEFMGAPAGTLADCYVTVNTDPDRFHNLLQPDDLTPSTGEMTIRRENLDGGTFSSILNVYVDVIFIKVGGELHNPDDFIVSAPDPEAPIIMPGEGEWKLPFKPIIINKPRHPVTPDFVTLDSFTVKAKNNGKVTIKWSTGIERNNAGFQIWRANPLDGKCGDDPNNYVNVQAVAPLVPSQGNEVSGAEYHYTDMGLTAGETYCYALADIEYDSEEPTFHLDKVREVVAR